MKLHAYAAKYFKYLTENPVYFYLILIRILQPEQLRILKTFLEVLFVHTWSTDRELHDIENLCQQGTLLTLPKDHILI